MLESINSLRESKLDSLEFEVQKVDLEIVKLFDTVFLGRQEQYDNLISKTKLTGANIKDEAEKLKDKLLAISNIYLEGEMAKVICDQDLLFIS